MVLGKTVFQNDKPTLDGIVFGRIIYFMFHKSVGTFLLFFAIGRCDISLMEILIYVVGVRAAPVMIYVSFCCNMLRIYRMIIPADAFVKIDWPKCQSAGFG